MDDLEFHWLCGILEGEATFVAGPPSAPRSPVVRVVMTDLDVMRRVGADLGRAIVAGTPREHGYKTPYTVSVKGVDAVRLMVQSRRDLGIARQAQIARALDGWGSGRTRWSYRGRRCAAEDCEKSAAIKGLCPAHFNRWYKAMQRGSTTAFQPRSITPAEILIGPPDHERTPGCEVAWLAGLLEGEGTFSRTHADGHAYPVLAVKMCSQDVVLRAAAALGTTNVHEAQPRDASWRITYRASISGAAAADWMQRLRPLMGERRRSAIDLALDDYYPIRLPTAPEHCVVPGCTEPHRGRGLCHKHYMSWSRDVARGRTPRVRPLRSN